MSTRSELPAPSFAQIEKMRKMLATDDEGKIFNVGHVLLPTHQMLKSFRKTLEEPQLPVNEHGHNSQNVWCF